jgi:hypothetical protein
MEPKVQDLSIEPYSKLTEFRPRHHWSSSNNYNAENWQFFKIQDITIKSVLPRTLCTCEIYMQLGSVRFLA